MRHINEIIDIIIIQVVHVPPKVLISIFILLDQTGIIVPLVQCIGLFPQHVSAESPECSFNSLLALGIHGDTPRPFRHTTSKAYTM